MIVNPRIVDVCIECSMEGGEFDETVTTQWLREIKIPSGRGCFGPRHPMTIYICSECGAENYG